jgi:nitrite reductase/ring-hydroxylating ferredoxin subunit
MRVTGQLEAQAERIDRRRLLRCAAVCGAAAPVLVACGSGEEDPSGTAEPDATGGSGGSGDVLVQASEVPVGGGVVLDDVIVTQPTEGEFVAYTAACTHQGGKITAVSDDGVMTCSLHGSQFAIEDGENLVGPSGDPGGSVADLPQVEITVDGDDITRA